MGGGEGNILRNCASEGLQNDERRFLRNGREDPSKDFKGGEGKDNLSFSRRKEE